MLPWFHIRGVGAFCFFLYGGSESCSCITGIYKPGGPVLSGRATSFLFHGCTLTRRVPYLSNASHIGSWKLYLWPTNRRECRPQRTSELILRGAYPHLGPCSVQCPLSAGLPPMRYYRLDVTKTSVAHSVLGVGCSILLVLFSPFLFTQCSRY